MNTTKNTLFLSLILFATFNAAGVEAIYPALAMANKILTWGGFTSGFGGSALTGKSNSKAENDKRRALWFLGGIGMVDLTLIGMLLASNPFSSAGYLGSSVAMYAGRFIVGHAMGNAIGSGVKRLTRPTRKPASLASLKRYIYLGAAGTALMIIGKRTGI